MESQSTERRAQRLDERIDAVVGRIVERPVKRAVREALREETVAVRSPSPEGDGSDDAAAEPGNDRSDGATEEAEVDGDGRRLLRRFIALAALAAAAGFVVQRRRGDDGDPFGDDLRSTADGETRPATESRDAEGTEAD
ncbi:hypothetical protein BRC97_00250 [Halobacteriales archaeon QS_6_71_20]|nr:MAG: hypothetical protein BRC97_00250 [Halobacteriales archaeon QS_6_71_20]